MPVLFHFRVPAKKSIAASGPSGYSAASRTLPIGARFSYPDLTIPYSSASIGVAAVLIKPAQQAVAGKPT